MDGREESEDTSNPMIPISLPYGLDKRNLAPSALEVLAV